MISTKAQRSSPRGQTTSRNPNFTLFALIFLIFFLIMYDLNRKHINFQLNWAEGVACRNSTIFSMKFKAPSRVRVRCLRSRIWASSRGQTRLGQVWWDAKFDSTQFQKNVPQSEFVCKSYDRFSEARPSYGSGRQNMLRIEIG
jgi:hypothetical protein